MTYKVQDNFEMPESLQGGKRKYPDLEIGQGFVAKSVPPQTPEFLRSTIISSYRRRNHKVTTQVNGLEVYVMRTA